MTVESTRTRPAEKKPFLPQVFFIVVQGGDASFDFESLSLPE